jgi:DNA modification methylase
VNYEATWRHAAGINNSEQVGKVANDDRDSWAAALRHFPGDVVYLWHSALHAPAAYRSLAVVGFEVRAQIIWVKKRLIISRGHYHWRHEPCLFAVRSGAPSARWYGGRKQGTVWADVVDAYCRDEELFAFKVDEESLYLFEGGHTTVWEIAHDKACGGGHSTQKPVECMGRPIRNHGGREDAVYDPFVGSGSTLIAAEQLGRRCYAADIEPRWCDVCVERWQNLTGEKALRHD